MNFYTRMLSGLFGLRERAASLAEVETPSIMKSERGFLTQSLWFLASYEQPAIARPTKSRRIKVHTARTGSWSKLFPPRLIKKKNPHPPPLPPWPRGVAGGGLYTKKNT